MEPLQNTLEMIRGKENSGNERVSEKKKIKGRVVLMMKNVRGQNDYGAFFHDQLHEVFGKGVSIQLISASHSANGLRGRGRLGQVAHLESWATKISAVTAREASFNISFEWDESFGVPGAFMLKNHHYNQFYLKTLTLEDVPDHGKVHCVCNSWVYPAHRYICNRVFFTNKTYLPSQTPETLRQYREEELKILRGYGSSGMLKEWDRVYDYDYYNDLGNPEKGPEYARPVLGGSAEYPYPRRVKTARPRNRKDPKTESRLALPSLNNYVPRDEQFNAIKFSDILAYGVKSLAQVLVPEIKANLFDKTPKELTNFEDVVKLYEDELSSDKSAWRTDEEFGREMLTGVNPVLIRRLKEFPPASKLDPKVYGNQTSSMTREQLENNMNGLTIDEAIENNKLFILDLHDALMPYLRKINTTASKSYASRTVLLLQEDGTLKPLAIELSLPHPQWDIHGATSHIFTPSEYGIENSIWQLAKAYAAVSDSGYHKLISHWLNTHAVIEPFVIAMNRQLSVVHPVYKLLCPHFSETMNMNALARQFFLNAGGVNEMTLFPAKFSMEMSSFIYKSWVFTDQALPADLLKRGVAIEDSSRFQGLRLLIEDYPYAVDGLEIWFAIETWVSEYCSIYYSTDDLVKDDPELQSWWIELQVEGHGDKKDEPWWPKMQTKEELIHVCTIVIWVASALYAEVSFGQFPYDSYLPDRPAVSHHFMPEPGTPEFTELKPEPEKGFLKTITNQVQTQFALSLAGTLSRHSKDEIYLGQRDCPDWTCDAAALEAFERFGKNLLEIEKRIVDRNKDEKLKNRRGPVNVSNTADDSEECKLTGKGIPNSASI